MFRRLLCVIAMVAATAGCAERKALLEYRFPPGYREHYRWHITAVTRTESPTEQTTRRLEAVLDLEETVRRERNGRMILAVRLEPLSVQENGKDGPIPPPSTAEYDIDSHGRIRGLVKAGLSAGAVSSLELDTLASQIRPALSPEPVALGGTWNAPLRIRAERTSIDFRGAGRLAGFELSDRRRLGRIRTQRRGRISSEQSMNNAPVSLRGTSVSRGLARLDIDHGLLFSSTDRSSSEFDVLLSGRPAAKLKVTLTSRLQLRPSGRAPVTAHAKPKA